MENLAPLTIEDVFLATSNDEQPGDLTDTTAQPDDLHRPSYDVGLENMLTTPPGLAVTGVLVVATLCIAAMVRLQK